MATTYTYNDAWNVTRQQYPSSAEQTAWDYATNIAVEKMWCAYDWRGTTNNLPPFWLVPGTQDYGAPFYVVPTDFYGVRECYLVEIGANAIPVRTPIRTVSNLEATHMVGLPQSICYRPAISGFRVHPAAAYGAACPLYLIDGIYKQRPPKITRSLASQLLLWDDVYFNSFCQALAWGALIVSGRRKDALEQEQIFNRVLAQSTATEELELGEPIVHPSEPLIMPSWNQYGWWPI